MEESEIEEEEEEEMVDPAEALMQRGEYLRQLRQLELDDEQQRRNGCDQEMNNNNNNLVNNDLKTDQVDVLPDSKYCVLRYESYLLHQSYYDDLKHVDYKFVDYGSLGQQVDDNNNDNNHDDDDKAAATCSSRLVIEQDKSLGKGGLCWDAAFILSEFLITNQHQWLRTNDAVRTTTTTTTTSSSSMDCCCNLIELGSGTGLCGLMLAKAMQNNNPKIASHHVYVTDLPELQHLLRRNAQRNFSNVIISTTNDALDDDEDDDDSFQVMSQRDEDVLWQRSSHCNPPLDEHKTGSTVSVGVLRWGNIQDYDKYPPADVVIGADVVASLYDPVALAQTIHQLCRDENSLVFTSYKKRLNGPHEQFDQELGRLFRVVEHFLSQSMIGSRNKNPDVRIIRATGKRISIL